MTDSFLFARSNLPNVLISIAKKFFPHRFSFRLFWCTKSIKFHFRWGTKPRNQKQETGNDYDVNSGLQDSQKQISPTFSYFLINNALLYHFLAIWSAHNKKMTEKSVFGDAWSPELTSQSFPVSFFWSRGFVPHRKWNLMLLVHQNTGKENRYRKSLYLSVQWRDLIEQIKKKSVIYTLSNCCSVIILGNIYSHLVSLIFVQNIFRIVIF